MGKRGGESGGKSCLERNVNLINDEKGEGGGRGEKGDEPCRSMVQI